MAELEPCPFCGAGQTTIRENGRVWTGQRFGEPSSVSVRHWCEPVEGQPARMIERVGRDEASAIAAWNSRAERAEAAQRVPLTKAQLHRLYLNTPETLDDTTSFAAFERMFRLFERVHRIGATDPKGDGNVHG